MSAPVMAGAEPFSATGSEYGALVLHGFSGCPHSMRGLADQLAAAGLTVELPLLPGHGTAIEDMLETRWSDYSAAVDDAYVDLAARCDRVAVVGLSMGGTLACWLAARHPAVAGLVLVNPLVQPGPVDLRPAIRQLLDDGTEIAPPVGSDIADPDAVEISYDGSPLAAALSLYDATESVAASLADIRCPVLLFSSRQDHVVDPANGDRVEAWVAGPVERVHLERSYHTATLDFDRDEIEARTVTFLAGVLRGADA